MRRSIQATAVALSLVVVVAGLAVGYGPLQDPNRLAPDPARGGGVSPADELAAKKDRRVLRIQSRLDALEAARARNEDGQMRVPGAAAAPGWVGQFPMDNAADDWEPAIAADPAAPYVYLLTTRYGEAKPCPGNCPSPWIALEVSTDGGATWSAGRPLCACKGSGQFDPIVEVVPSNGHVYALYMNGFNVVFVKSTNHGQTWTAPVKTYGNVSWNDKPVLATSDDGQHVYVSWNGPSGGDPYVAQSHDAGATWTQTKLVDSGRYYFAFDADVAPDGTVYFSESSLLYAQGGAVSGNVDHHLFISRDAGATWQNRVVASVAAGPACDADGCSADFYLGHNAVSADATGALVYLYDGASTPGGPQAVRSIRSTDRGATWTAPVSLSTAGENGTSPAVESRASGDVRAWYMETNGGSDDAWSVWYRSSADGGATWTAAVKISDATGGAAYKTAAGFLEVYGDYGEIAITSSGKTIATWGEGFSWTGPGGTWLNRQP